jgi:hypothetical protein
MAEQIAEQIAEHIAEHIAEQIADTLQYTANTGMFAWGGISKSDIGVG